MKNFYKQILDDVAIELTDEFDQNFQRKAFFDRKWRQTKLINRRGSLMMRTAQLRRSIQMRQGSQSVSWRSSRLDASIHNEGGEITVTAKMKKYFWAMFMREGKKGIEAEQFKAMALKKVGSKMTIPQRQFIGDHPEVRKAIERCADQNFQEIDKYMIEILRQK